MTLGRRLRLRRGLAFLLALSFCLAGCRFLEATSDRDPDIYRDAMRAWVIELSAHARESYPGFLVVAQNGEELITSGRTHQSPLSLDYINALDGLGREDLFYGYDADNEPTPTDASEWMLGYLTRAELVGLTILVTDYCWDSDNVAHSEAANAAHGFLSFAAPSRELDRIPQIQPAEDGRNVVSFAEARHFLYLLNPGAFASREAYLSALENTHYDLLIIDPEYEGTPLPFAEIERLRAKPLGASRLLLAYLSIGEAEAYRSYWDTSWSAHPPDWLREENPHWPGNYSVDYWNDEWQGLVYSSLDAILAAGFDGVYLDRVDVYKEFEE